MMKTIRKAIMDDKSLSTYAHNIKVIAQGGKVTLKGPVHTEEEKRAIEAKAVEVAGTGNVTNDISVKGDSADRKTNH
jgi:osmotically-inducible protein OsmY